MFGLVHITSHFFQGNLWHQILQTGSARLPMSQLVASEDGLSRFICILASLSVQGSVGSHTEENRPTLHEILPLLREERFTERFTS